MTLTDARRSQDAIPSWDLTEERCFVASDFLKPCRRAASLTVSFGNTVFATSRFSRVAIVLHVFTSPDSTEEAISSGSTRFAKGIRDQYFSGGIRQIISQTETGDAKIALNPSRIHAIEPLICAMIANENTSNLKALRPPSGSPNREVVSAPDAQTRGFH